jgi:Zn-dependent alcohol dehydrogenase
LFSIDLTGFTLVGMGATLNVAKPKKGQSVAIFGLGAVGLAVSFLSLYVLLFLPTAEGL